MILSSQGLWEYAANHLALDMHSPRIYRLIGRYNLPQLVPASHVPHTTLVYPPKPHPFPPTH